MNEGEQQQRIPDDELKQRIAAIFGVTVEEIDALDPLFEAERLAREQRQREADAVIERYHRMIARHFPELVSE